MNSSTTASMQNCTPEEKQSSTLPKMPLKKRSPRLIRPHKRTYQVQKKLRKRATKQYQQKGKNYGHVQRVKFTLFLKVLMKHLFLTDEELYDRAQMVRRWTPFRNFACCLFFILIWGSCILFIIQL